MQGLPIDFSAERIGIEHLETKTLEMRLSPTTYIDSSFVDYEDNVFLARHELARSLVAFPEGSESGIQIDPIATEIATDGTALFLKTELTRLKNAAEYQLWTKDFGFGFAGSQPLQGAPLAQEVNGTVLRIPFTELGKYPSEVAGLFAYHFINPDEAERRSSHPRRSEYELDLLTTSAGVVAKYHGVSGAVLFRPGNPVPGDVGQSLKEALHPGADARCRALVHVTPEGFVARKYTETFTVREHPLGLVGTTQCPQRAIDYFQVDDRLSVLTGGRHAQVHRYKLHHA